ncbi:MAG: hypothetical protein GYB19_13570 [Rhodospirillales bacterium]|nr:hypothetical protein [Rhodospirillales bacterium]
MDCDVGHPGKPEDFLLHRMPGGKSRLLLTVCPKKSTSLTFWPKLCSFRAIFHFNRQWTKPNITTPKNSHEQRSQDKYMILLIKFGRKISKHFKLENPKILYQGIDNQDCFATYEPFKG